MRLINIDSEFKKRKKSLIFQFYVTQNSRELRNIFNFQSHVKLDSFDVFFSYFSSQDYIFKIQSSSQLGSLNFQFFKIFIIGDIFIQSKISFKIIT
jgi:hypothetical protein